VTTLGRGPPPRHNTPAFREIGRRLRAVVPPFSTGQRTHDVRTQVFARVEELLGTSSLLGIAKNQRTLGQWFTAAAAAGERGLWSTVVQWKTSVRAAEGLTVDVAWEMEAPPGFEPGMEVLQISLSSLS
jgi:hypothetical protein